MRDVQRPTAAGAGLDPAVFADGAGADAFVRRLAADPGRTGGMDLADAVHWLHTVHGRTAGVIDSASLTVLGDGERRWFARAVDGWRGERIALATLALAVGPLPSTPGQANDDRALERQLGALATLAGSDRAGVPLGAAAALVIDWHALRPLLMRAADRFGATIGACDLPPVEDTLAVAGDPPRARAIRFGADQLLRQHRLIAEALVRRSEARAALA